MRHGGHMRDVVKWQNGGTCADDAGSIPVIPPIHFPISSPDKAGATYGMVESDGKMMKKGGAQRRRGYTA